MSGEWRQRQREHLIRCYIMIAHQRLSIAYTGNLSVALPTSGRLSPQVLNLKTGEMYVLGTARS